jgi:hypothetical protein
MADNGIFTAAGSRPSANLGQYKEAREVSKCPGIVMDVTDPSEYEFSRGSMGMTQLPVTKPRLSAPEGSDNPYGVILPGKVFSGEQHTVVGESKIEFPKAAPAPAPVPEEPQTKQSKKQKKLSSAINAVVAEAEKQEELQSVKPVSSSIRVKMKGSFGSYTGNFHSYTESGDWLILMYSLSNDVYEPPQDDQNSLQITVNNETFAVFYLGISFEVQHLGYGFQVYYLQQE